MKSNTNLSQQDQNYYYTKNKIQNKQQEYTLFLKDSVKQASQNSEYKTIEPQFIYSMKQYQTVEKQQIRDQKIKEIKEYKSQQQGNQQQSSHNTKRSSQNKNLASKNLQIEQYSEQLKQQQQLSFEELQQQMVSKKSIIPSRVIVTPSKQQAQNMQYQSDNNNNTNNNSGIKLGRPTKPAYNLDKGYSGSSKKEKRHNLPQIPKPQQQQNPEREKKVQEIFNIKLKKKSITHVQPKNYNMMENQQQNQHNQQDFYKQKSYNNQQQQQQKQQQNCNDQIQYRSQIMRKLKSEASLYPQHYSHFSEGDSEEDLPSPVKTDRVYQKQQQSLNRAFQQINKTLQVKQSQMNQILNNVAGGEQQQQQQQLQQQQQERKSVKFIYHNKDIPMQIQSKSRSAQPNNNNQNRNNNNNTANKQKIMQIINQDVDSDRESKENPLYKLDTQSERQDQQAYLFSPYSPSSKSVISPYQLQLKQKEQLLRIQKNKQLLQNNQSQSDQNTDGSMAIQSLQDLSQDQKQNNNINNSNIQIKVIQNPKKYLKQQFSSRKIITDQNQNQQQQQMEFNYNNQGSPKSSEGRKVSLEQQQKKGSFRKKQQENSPSQFKQQQQQQQQDQSLQQFGITKKKPTVQQIEKFNTQRSQKIIQYKEQDQQQQSEYFNNNNSNNNVVNMKKKFSQKQNQKENNINNSLKESQNSLTSLGNQQQEEDDQDETAATTRTQLIEEEKKLQLLVDLIDHENYVEGFQQVYDNSLLQNMELVQQQQQQENKKVNQQEIKKYKQLQDLNNTQYNQPQNLKQQNYMYSLTIVHNNGKQEAQNIQEVQNNFENNLPVPSIQQQQEMNQNDLLLQKQKNRIQQLKQQKQQRQEINQQLQQQKDIKEYIRGNIALPNVYDDYDFDGNDSFCEYVETEKQNTQIGFYKQQNNNMSNNNNQEKQDLQIQEQLQGNDNDDNQEE